MDDIAALRAEIERLRDLCEENGIDPNPVADRIINTSMVEYNDFTKAAVEIGKSTNAFLNSPPLAKTEFKIGKTWRIRLPIDFTDNPSSEAPDYLAFARDLNNT